MLSPINFTGLTKNLSRQPYDKLSAIEKVASTSQSQIVGKLPSDIVKEILKNNPNPQEAIKELYLGFASCANELQNIFLATQDCVQNFEIFPVAKEIYEIRHCEDPWESRKFVEKTFIHNEKVIAKEKENMEKAQGILTQACKKAKVIPPNGSIRLYSLGQGSFGVAYQICFLDEDKKEIFHSKVMKIFPLKEEEYNATMELKIAQNALYNLIYDYCIRINQEEYEKLKEAARKRMSEPSDYFEKFQRGMRPEIEMEDIHGFLPETNRGLYISKKLGKNYMRANFAPFYYSDLGNNFFITEMVDRDLPNVDKRYELSDLGFKNTDSNRRNIVCYRLIDYGGLQILSKNSGLFDSYYTSDSYL